LSFGDVTSIKCKFADGDHDHTGKSYFIKFSFWFKSNFKSSANAPRADFNACGTVDMIIDMEYSAGTLIRDVASTAVASGIWPDS